MNFSDAVAFAQNELANIDAWTEAHKLSNYVADGAELGVTLDDVEEWIELSAHSRDIFDAVSIRCAQLLRAGADLPSPLKIWIADVLSGDRQPPRIPNSNKRGGKSSIHQRDLRIFYVVQRLVNQGMTATRNDTSPPVSACDAVAEALARMKKSPAAYSTIKEVYASQKKGQLFRLHPGVDPDPNVGRSPEGETSVGEITDY